MGDLLKGYTFSGTSPNNSVTAPKLNSLVDQASIQTVFFTGKTEKLVPVTGDWVLIYSPADNDFRKVQVGNMVPTARSKKGFTNLQAEANTSTNISVSADELLLRSDAGVLAYITNFSAQLDLTLYSGGATVNGRDFASVTGNSWAYFHAIADASGNNGLLLSASATAPTLPTGYSFHLLLGAVRINNSAVFVRFTQRGCDVSIDLSGPAGAKSSATGLINPITGSTPAEFSNQGADVAMTLQTVDVSQCVPPNITGRVRGLLGSSDNTTNYWFAVAPEGNFDITSSASNLLRGLQLWTTNVLSAKRLGFGTVVNFDVLLRSNTSVPSFSWAVNSTGSTMNMRVTGYRLNFT